MNLNHLRVFTAVSNEGSISAAARALRVSQPAVSKQLAELEEALGTRLVDRLPRGTRLTGSGRLLESHARRIFQSEAQAESELEEFLGLRRGRLSVGASTTIGSYLVPDLFARFKRAHPSLELELEIANTAAIQAAVREDRLDLGLTEGFVEGEALDVEVVAHDEMVMIASPRDPILKCAPLSVRDLSGIPILMREHGSGTRDVIEAALREQGVQIEPLMSLGSSEALKTAVEKGLGTALLSRLAVELELRTGSLVAVEIKDMKIRRALHLLTLEGKTQSPAALKFIELLRKNSVSLS